MFALKQKCKQMIATGRGPLYFAPLEIVPRVIMIRVQAHAAIVRVASPGTRNSVARTIKAMSNI